MNIAIIGAGFTGLSAAHKAKKNGHHVTMFEARGYPGGLASGFLDPAWSWTVEHHYHHIFASDREIIQLFKENQLSELLLFKQTKTALLSHGQMFPFDSPKSIMTFPYLSAIDKLRLGLVMVGLKTFPAWKILEKMTAKEFLLKTMGTNSWQNIWEPLFIGKFGELHNQVNAAWFWARINARTKKLGYFQGGFQNAANQLVKQLETKGVAFHFNTKVQSLIQKDAKISIVTDSSEFIADKVLFAGPPTILKKLIDLPLEYLKSIDSTDYTGAVTLVTESTKPFFPDGTYWLNINQESPILAIVDHTNFIDKSHYNNKHITYFGKYTSKKDLLASKKDSLLEMYKDEINSISPKFLPSITNAWIFSSDYAQPIPTPNHSKRIPSFNTPIKNLFWASMQHIYPWDRGTNYAVKLGARAIDVMLGS